jgi:hypothetical protein
MGPHLHQGRRDPLHGAFGEGGVTAHLHIERLSRQQSRQQAHGGTGIAQIEGRIRRLQPVQTRSVNRDLTLIGPLDAYPHGTKSIEGGQAVFAFQKATDPGDPLRQGAQHDGTMGDGLVSGYAQATAQTAAG